MQAFNKWLSSPDTKPGSLKGLRYAVFGLGDSNYVYYQSMSILSTCFFMMMLICV